MPWAVFRELLTVLGTQGVGLGGCGLLVCGFVCGEKERESTSICASACCVLMWVTYRVRPAKVTTTSCFLPAAEEV